MGADFIASWIIWPLNRTFGEWKEEAEKRINTIESIDDIDEPDALAQAFDLEDVEELEELMVRKPEKVKQWLGEHLSFIDPNDRECGTGTVGDQQMLITGGATWGDEPTEAFGHMNAVNAAIGVLFKDEVFTTKEQLIIHECAHQALRRPIVLRGIVDEMDDTDIDEACLERLRDKLRGENAN